MKRLLSARSLLLTGACLAWLSPAFAQEDSSPSDSAPAVEQEEEARQETVVVRGLFIPDEKRSTSEVAALIDEGDFSLQGDGDAAAALARVAGIATAEDEFIYVRGLNERYSTALLNGSPLPSPAPLRRVVPLNLFPTSALKSVLVQKTYSPNLPGEFGGGLVDLRTKTVPDEAFFTVGAKLARDTSTTLRNGLMYDGTDTDILGFDDGARDLPSLADGLTTEFGRQLTDNSSLLVMQEGEVAPNFSIDMSGGNNFDLTSDISMGVIAAVGYGNSWQTKRGTRGYGDLEGDGLRSAFQQDRLSTQNTIDTNALATIGFEAFSDHEIKFTGLVTRSSEKEARIITGENNEDVNQRLDALEWVEQQLWSTQVQGEHFLPQVMDMKVEWRASYSEALRDAPYQLSNIYNINDAGVPILSTSPAANRMQFSKVEDDTTDFGIDGTLPMTRDGECTFLCEADLKFGYSYVENDRAATSLLYDINGVGGTDRTQRLDYIYDYIFRSGVGSITEVAGEQFPQFYVATLEIDAAYAGIDAQITPYIRAALGVRFEDAIEAIDTQNISGDLTGNTVEGVIDQSDWLPALTITWNPIEDLQVRGGYSETLTRPQFRELAPAVFVNTETDATFFGNPYLVNASIKNYDLRGEYYFARDQFVTLGLFYKDLENPIEEILAGTETIQTTFINVPSAKLYGFEVEYEQLLPFDQWTGLGFFDDREVQVKTNYTWSDSEIGADGEVAFNIGTNLNPVRGTTTAAGRLEDGRRMQGQSEHLFNVQLGLLNEEAQSEYNLLFNYVSERIRSGENGNLPAILEQPPMTVDFVWNKRFQSGSGQYEFSLNIENILQEDYEAFQERGGDRVDVDTYEQGTIFSIGLKRMF
ncbi:MULTISPECIES: TonB-dependent receptor domain-containing protein [unclassified Hyphomonas]|jgi:outer membrane receptor protein involved in Fe transport|uniref:TonB-dependent receptor domain-containing protein n=4 Tax=Hyphomonas TaxID=85 RepID=UPI000C973B9C|nr:MULTISPECIES: TonB-dependent receptor [unclassified Hyphomonas]MAL46414.1 TonB-dependent receptor [Hyphomonas sp.]HBT35920.1 TonB-dependent receptor [Hyphomonas sp.]HBU34283.1 TonB-dependent receptor [Hyphomonas sp.]HBX94793.1 TonB-dependent receptor [Hyphomonas sp.]|tara:strand:- start:728 stop:3337 length:2610 start_codon:yes stop_codon:yes gene_type:complete